MVRFTIQNIIRQDSTTDMPVEMIDVLADCDCGYGARRVLVASVIHGGLITYEDVDLLPDYHDVGCELNQPDVRALLAKHRLDMAGIVMLAIMPDPQIRPDNVPESV